MTTPRGTRLAVLGALVALVLALVVVFAWAPDSLLVPTPTDPAVASCGEEVSGQAGPVNVAGRACFWAAWEQRRPAEFRMTRPTIEGDPITYVYRIRPDGRVEVIIDSRQDRFSNQEVTFLECRDLVRTDDPALPDPIEFWPGDDCTERPGP